MERRCDVVFAGKGSPKPEDYSDRIWISSTWSDDGRTIFALGHDEYQAHRHPGMCKYSTYIQCWYNAVVPLKSIDGGRRFEKMGERPVATIPIRQNIDQGKNRGFFEPSNIIRYNGYYYALIRTGNEGAQKAGTCVFRTPDLSRPDAWRVFDGVDFVPNVDPYRDSAVGAKPCEVLDNVKGIVGSVNYIPKYRTFIAVSSFKGDIDQSGAIYYSLSDDLFHWSESRILLRIPTMWSAICGQPHYGYPSLIDISTSDRNFENIESDPYLYLDPTALARLFRDHGSRFGSYQSPHVSKVRARFRRADFWRLPTSAPMRMISPIHSAEASSLDLHDLNSPPIPRFVQSVGRNRNWGVRWRIASRYSCQRKASPILAYQSLAWPAQPKGRGILPQPPELPRIRPSSPAVPGAAA